MEVFKTSRPLPIIRFVDRSQKTKNSGMNETQHFKARVILLTDNKLNEKLGRLNTEDNETDGVRSMVPEPRTDGVDSSVIAT